MKYEVRVVETRTQDRSYSVEAENSERAEQIVVNNPNQKHNTHTSEVRRMYAVSESLSQGDVR